MKKLTILGTISTALGSIGATISGLSLCPCVLAPIFSIAGIVSITTSFLTKTNIYLISLGLFLLIISLIFHKKKKVCKIHN